MSAPEWAWEFLRLSEAYRADAKRADLHKTILRRRPPLAVIEDNSTIDAEDWGLCAFSPANFPASKTVIAWRPETCVSVLAVSVAPAKTAGIDFQSLSNALAVIRTRSAGEHVVLFDGAHSLQLHIVDGTILDGPVELKFHVEGVDAAEQKIVTLNRLLSLLRKGFLPPPPLPQPRTAQRWLLALKAFPLVQANFSDREIAAKLFPDHDIRRWNDANDWIRSHIRRARAAGQSLVAGGYRKLLSWEMDS